MTFENFRRVRMRWHNIWSLHATKPVFYGKNPLATFSFPIQLDGIGNVNPMDYTAHYGIQTTESQFDMFISTCFCGVQKCKKCKCTKASIRCISNCYVDESVTKCNEIDNSILLVSLLRLKMKIVCNYLFICLLLVHLIILSFIIHELYQLVKFDLTRPSHCGIFGSTGWGWYVYEW